jgi:hypothetical protein
MSHDHVQVAVEGSTTSGVENIPAHNLGDGTWRLLRSPLYALQLAAGDTIRITNKAGAFEVIAHGGNVAIQFYLAECQSDDAQATANAARKMAPEIMALGGRMDGQTAGLIVYTIPIAAGFSAIEKLFETATDEFPGAQWQYSNVYDQKTGEPLRWWE